MRQLQRSLVSRFASRCVRACAGAVAAWTVSGAVAAHAVRIELRAAADTPATQVKLADVASIRDADDATAARLGALDIGQVSADGAPTVVERVALARWVQARAGLSARDIVWVGAERCSLRIAQASMPVAPAEAPVNRVARASTGGVTRGNVAVMHSSSGAIRLESRVEVLQDGAVGEAVRVRLPGASDGVLARVVAPGQVEISQ